MAGVEDEISFFQKIAAFQHLKLFLGFLKIEFSKIFQFCAEDVYATFLEYAKSNGIWMRNCLAHPETWIQGKPILI